MQPRCLEECNPDASGGRGAYPLLRALLVAGIRRAQDGAVDHLPVEVRNRLLHLLLVLEGHKPHAVPDHFALRHFPSLEFLLQNIVVPIGRQARDSEPMPGARGDRLRVPLLDLLLDRLAQVGNRRPAAQRSNGVKTPA